MDKVVGLRGLVCGVWCSVCGARCEEVMLPAFHKQKPAKCGRLSLLSCVAVSGI